MPAADGRTTDLVNPATGEVFATAPLSGEADVDAACAAAAAAFETWRDVTPSRAQPARCCASPTRIEERADELVDLECENTGKPRQLTLDEEVPPAVDQIRYFAGAARLLHGLSAGEYMAGHTSFIRREPVGVCAQVTPWNYPFMMAVWKWAPAHRRRQHRRAQAVGHHAGVHALDGGAHGRVPAAGRVQRHLRRPRHGRGAGRATRSRRWCRSPAASARAMAVAKAAADDLKRVHLELGGKAPVVVFDDADIAAAAEAIAGAGYFNAGPGLHGRDAGAGRTARARRLRQRAGGAGHAPRTTGPPDDARRCTTAR